MSHYKPSRFERVETEWRAWRAGWNKPGYMPDAEPADFETFDEARAYIVEQMRSWADEIEEMEGNEGEPDSLREAADRWEKATEGEHGETVGQDHYWIVKAETRG